MESAAAPFRERMSSVPPNLRAGARIGGKYELLRRVGSGAMGQVWAARHLSLQEEVALKIVMRDVAHDDGSSSESRFLLEARLASQLSRKTRHIISVTDHGEDGPYAYLAMELLEGESLDARLARKGPMSIGKVVPLVYQIARALSVAHADGIVHRDLKPSNVFVTVDEDQRALIKILDFGIAKLRASMRRIPINADDAKHTTLRGFLLGTPAYMSPEQARGKTLDHRADVWALAVIAYHLLSGEFPFDGETADELFERLVNVDPIPIESHRPELPPSISALFDQAFARRIENRFQSAVALASALEQIATRERRAFGEMPAAMNTISLPPPSSKKIAEVTPPAPVPVPLTVPVPPPTLDAPKHDHHPSSLVAAGVPRKHAIWGRLAFAVVVLVMFLTTASAITLYLERDSYRSTMASSSSPSSRPPKEDDRTLIPTPGPAVVQTKILPPEPPIAITPQPVFRPSPEARPTTTTASLPPRDPPVVPAISPPAPAAVARKIDNRSEVF